MFTFFAVRSKYQEEKIKIIILGLVAMVVGHVPSRKQF